jgi:uncharacterized membrane protein (DUF2068 family)
MSEDEMSIHNTVRKVPVAPAELPVFSSANRNAAVTVRDLDRSVGLRVIAAFEAVKGLVVLLAGFGVLLLIHRDVQALAERLVAHLHLNPGSRYPRIFLHIATGSTPTRLRLLAFGAFVYSTVRFVEAAGLWRARRWAEWFGAATGLIYVPFEVMAFIHRPELEPLLALVLNLVVVLFLGIQLRRGSDSEVVDTIVRAADGFGDTRRTMNS